MTTIAAVTTMNQAYYDNIGHKLIESFIKYWPKDIVLHVYTEGFTPPVVAPNVQYHDVFERCNPGLQNFLDWRGEHFTRKFAYKAYTWINACKQLDVDRLIYLDADSETLKSVPREWLETMCDKDSILAYMYAPATIEHNGQEIVVDNAETCIYWFNRRHKFAKKFMDRYEHIYESREIDNREIYRKPHDTWVMTDCVRLANERGWKVINLHPEKKARTPIKHTVLNEYFAHFKGKSKYNQD
jgi:hypothetical protein